MPACRGSVYHDIADKDKAFVARRNASIATGTAIKQEENDGGKDSLSCLLYTLFWRVRCISRVVACVRKDVCERCSCWCGHVAITSDVEFFPHASACSHSHHVVCSCYQYPEGASWQCKHGHRYREAEDGQDKEDVAHGSGGLGQVISCLYALRCV